MIKEMSDKRAEESLKPNGICNKPKPIDVLLGRPPDLDESDMMIVDTLSNIGNMLRD